MALNDLLQKAGTVAQDVARVAVVTQQYAAAIEASRAQAPYGTARVAASDASRLNPVARTGIIITPEGATGMSTKAWTWLGGFAVLAIVAWWFFKKKRS